MPRFADVPPIDVFLIDRPDLPSVGAGETPLISVAPAIGNAVFDACGVRLRDLPLNLPGRVSGKIRSPRGAGARPQRLLPVHPTSATAGKPACSHPG